MKTNLFKTKVLVWMLLIIGLFGNYTFGQTPPPGRIDASGLCVNRPNSNSHPFFVSGGLSGTPGRNTFPSIVTNDKRIIWENNRWEIQSSNDNGVTFAAIYYNTYASAPFPPSFGTGTWAAVGNCDPLTDFNGDGTQTNLGTGGPITAIPSVTCAGALATYTFNYYVQNGLPANAIIFRIENISPVLFSNIKTINNLENNAIVKINGITLPINSTNFQDTQSWSSGVQMKLTQTVKIPANANIEVVLIGVLSNTLNPNTNIAWRTAISTGITIESYSTAFSPTQSSVPTPIFTQVAPICKGATLAELPSTSTNNITGTWLPAIDNLTTTTYIFTPNVGVCPSTATMTIVVKNTQVPQISSPQAFCQGQKVADLVATGTALKWYNASSGGSELAATDVLTATTYYVSQTVDGCESDRMPVVVTFKTGPSVQANNIKTTPTACNIGTISIAPNITTDNTVLIDESFNALNPNVCTIYNDAFYEILGQNFVKLTTNQNSKNGQLLFAKTSTAPKAFELKFDAFMLNKDGADGFSVNYGEIGNIQSLQEDGNSTGLVLRFKNYNQDRIQLIYNNVQIGSDYNLILEDGNWWTYTVTVSDIGQISLKRKRLDNTGSEISIFTNETIPNFTTTPNFQWAFAARTGGQNNEHIIDAVKFTDKTPLQFSYDQTNWQTATTFTNVPAGFRTVYARAGNTGCPANIVGGSINVVGTTPPTPTFSPITAICKGATLDPLPTTSNNNYIGTWAPALDNMATTTYTFTPDAGQCASTATMTITVNEPVTPTFTGSTVVLDKRNSSNPNFGTFTVTTPATYRIELWGKGGTNSGGGFGGGYSGSEILLPAVNYDFGISNSSTYFSNSGNSIIMSAFAPALNSAGTGSGGTKNITGGSPSPAYGGGAAGWWGHNGASLNGSGSSGGDNGTPDNSSDGGDDGQNGKFPGGGGGGNGGVGAEGRILITKIEPIITNYCKGATMNALPTTSAEGINGTWLPALDNQTTKTYTFTPDAGQCASTATLEIIINETVTTTFTQIEPICKGATFFGLPTLSTNMPTGITGMWFPPINNQATTTYTFTPTAGQCASTAIMTIVVNALTVPSFSQVAPICKGATLAALPTTSTNGVAGTWAPAVMDNQATTTYSFTPTDAQCTSSTTMTVVVNNCSVISGVIYEDADEGTIGGTPLTVSGAYLSIYPAIELITFQSLGVSPPTQPIHAVPITMGTGAYTFPALPDGRYKIVIGTSANGSETPSFPNVGNFSMTYGAEGEAGTAGDGVPDGITYVTISAGAPVYDGGGNSRVRADAGVSFAIKQLAPLPVRLISFTGKSTENGNELTWKTSSEVNFSHFEVEKGPLAPGGGTGNGKFEKIGQVDGSSSEIYEFQDSTHSSGRFDASTGGLYRLKMVDLDGSSAYSKIIFIENKSLENTIGQIYPNPSNGEAKVNINTNSSGNLTLNTFDIKGKLIGKETLQLHKGINQLELKKLGIGLNYIQISDGKTTEVRKVLKQ